MPRRMRLPLRPSYAWTEQCPHAPTSTLGSQGARRNARVQVFRFSSDRRLKLLAPMDVPLAHDATSVTTAVTDGQKRRNHLGDEMDSTADIGASKIGTCFTQ